MFSVVDEMLTRFNQLETRQNEAHREEALRAEDLAEDRIRIWVDGTRQKYETMLTEQERVYEARISALEMVSGRGRGRWLR